MTPISNQQNFPLCCHPFLKNKLEPLNPRPTTLQQRHFLSLSFWENPESTFHLYPSEAKHNNTSLPFESSILVETIPTLLRRNSLYVHLMVSFSYYSLRVLAQRNKLFSPINNKGPRSEWSNKFLFMDVLISPTPKIEHFSIRNLISH